MGSIISGGGSDASADMEKSLRQAQDLMKQYYGQATGYMQPFYNSGTQALGDYQKALSGMSNPQQFYQQMMQGYNTSPQAQFQQEQAQKASNQAAAAGGTLGGGAQQKSLADYTQQLTSRDQQQYLNNMLGIHGQYMGGLSGLEQQGYGSAGQMGNWAMNTGNELSNLMSQIGQSKAYGDISKGTGLSGLLGGLTGGLAGGFGGMGGGSGGGAGGMASLFSSLAPFLLM